MATPSCCVPPPLYRKMSMLSLQPERLHPRCASYLAARRDAELPGPRRDSVTALVEVLRSTLATSDSVCLLFVCTHNARRSQLAQAWASAIAALTGVERVWARSAGTEVSQVDPRTIDALLRAGLRQADGTRGGDNPRYTLSFGSHTRPVTLWSKSFDDGCPQDGTTVAVMTCSEADAACPVVPRATARVSLPYEDPGRANGTAMESAAYDDVCGQIAAELLAVFTALAEGGQDGEAR